MVSINIPSLFINRSRAKYSTKNCVLCFIAWPQRVCKRACPVISAAHAQRYACPPIRITKHQKANSIKHITLQSRITFSKIQTLTPKCTLINFSIFCSRKRQTIVLKFNDCFWCLPTHVLYGILITCANIKKVNVQKQKLNHEHHKIQIMQCPLAEAPTPLKMKRGALQLVYGIPMQCPVSDTNLYSTL